MTYHSFAQAIVLSSRGAFKPLSLSKKRSRHHYSFSVQCALFLSTFINTSNHLALFSLYSFTLPLLHSTTSPSYFNASYRLDTLSST